VITVDHDYHCPWCGATLIVRRVEFGTEFEMECSNPKCEQPRWVFTLDVEHNAIMGFQCDNGDRVESPTQGGLNDSEGI
jgi:ssDNA-binding Zn-finger/Zn-ribbon topoisomerase 1